jgi:hypothetical protein
MKDNEERLRKLATQRGLDWDKMPDDMREDFVDNLYNMKGVRKAYGYRTSS